MADLMGIDLKYTHESTTGDLVTIDGIENFKRALIRRWITRPGEFVYRPGYGAGLVDYVNEIPNLATQKRIFKLIQEQALQDSRTENVKSVAFDSDDDNPSLVKITVRVKAKGYGDVDIAFTPFKLSDPIEEAGG